MYVVWAFIVILLCLHFDLSDIIAFAHYTSTACPLQKHAHYPCFTLLPMDACQAAAALPAATPPAVKPAPASNVRNVCSSYETFEGPLVFSVLILWWAAAAIKMQMFAMFANLDSREKEVVDNREERRPYLLTTQAFSWPVESINKICKTLISFDLVPCFLEYLII